ncbi:glycosyltransferase family 2 protein [Planktosalinus lacus]|uniref:Glycosyl transferase n=1 Tax=Planktosalinus lacus TaxID=1526573 RepID=A0A8J2Y8R4_9FLAO|nr:glycosyltransferase family 2 protein [Planktosalinus lacus]GGD84816.1 glycosyl transferase [Planktosalinus lacus]
MKKILSIITINYNNREGLQKTLDSVFCQSFTDYEYLIIDGASTDGSREVIENHKNRFTYWVSEPDDGIFNAMNKGIARAKGEYLLFLNSGDCLTSETALDNFINHKDFQGDIVYGDYTFEHGEKIYPDHLTPYYFMKTSLPHQSTLFHRSVFEHIGGYDESFKMVSDRAFYLKCFLSGRFTFKHIQYPLTLFDLTGYSNDAAHKNKKFVEDERMFQELYGLYYDDMKQLKKQTAQLDKCRRNTFHGIWKRIKKRMG